MQAHELHQHAPSKSQIDDVYRYIISVEANVRLEIRHAGDSADVLHPNRGKHKGTKLRGRGVMAASEYRNTHGVVKQMKLMGIQRALYRLGILSNGRQLKFKLTLSQDDGKEVFPDDMGFLNKTPKQLLVGRAGATTPCLVSEVSCSGADGDDGMGEQILFDSFFIGKRFL